MNITELEKLQERVARASAAVSKKDAEGFTQALNSQTEEKLVVQGMKSPDQPEDELLNLCVWIWSMKDYLKTLAVANGHTKQDIEEIVNNNDDLAIVGDIANRAKHGTLEKTRSGDYAKLSNVGYSINQTAIDSISFGESEITLDVGKPEDAKFHASIEFESGNRDSIDDAFPVVANALTAWETHAYSLAGA